jgi:hypothetical protein
MVTFGPFLTSKLAPVTFGVRKRFRGARGEDEPVGDDPYVLTGHHSEHKGLPTAELVSRYSCGKLLSAEVF